MEGRVPGRILSYYTRNYPRGPKKKNSQDCSKASEEETIWETCAKREENVTYKYRAAGTEFNCLRTEYFG
jgi:hypothetical protein